MGMGHDSKGMGMTEQEDRRASEREEIAARVASFKATQEKFRREREEYFFTTLENARHSDNSRHALERLPLWS
jgi:chorismate mutase